METQCYAPQDVPSVDRGGYRERESEWVFVGAESGEGGDGALGKRMDMCTKLGYCRLPSLIKMIIQNSIYKKVYGRIE